MTVSPVKHYSYAVTHSVPSDILLEREQMAQGFLFDQTKAMWLPFIATSIMNGSEAQQEVLFHLWHLPAADDWDGLIYLFID